MFVYDVLLEAVGYSTARILLPIVAFGYISVEPISSEEKGYSCLGFKSSKDSRYLWDATMAGWLGLIPWVS
ncbi:hypothetical protein [uncultured Cohaesibacter sp.]|uniref:hypothetical protein n=1 Tax=uncultured Cohaesibacter sp. TaxID=1002546 RepID=UPI002AA6559A|nr:hypothetical protein [uncultured Cohaesibacter sp.]